MYDHLATSSLEGIEALPHVKFSKGRGYLTKWWLAAKKWDILCDELKKIDEVFSANETSGTKSMETKKVIDNDISTYSKDRSNIVLNNTETSIGDWEKSNIGAEIMDNVNIDKDDIERIMESVTDSSLGSEINNEVEMSKSTDNRYNENFRKDYKEDYYTQQSRSPDSRNYFENDAAVPLDELYTLCQGHKARVICIGDVHGCVDEFKDLLKAVEFKPGDLVLLLGDLVAKGGK